MEIENEEKEEVFIGMLEKEWAQDHGFFGKARQGVFDEESAKRIETVLGEIEAHLQNDAFLSRRLVTLIWFIPLFLEWQIERIRDKGGNVDEFCRFRKTCDNLVFRILSLP